MLDLPRVVECARCGQETGVAEWHHCAVRWTDSWEHFLHGYKHYLRNSKEARFYIYLIESGQL